MASNPPPPPGFVMDDAPPPPPGFDIDDHEPASSHGRPMRLSPAGQVHDGDTFRLNTGDNARLLGVDAFELDQPGWDLRGNAVPLGRNAQGRLSRELEGGTAISDTGRRTYGRPVVTADGIGGDVGRNMVLSGDAIPSPQYLSADPTRRQGYIDAQREAIGDERGAYAGTYQMPSDYRRQGAAAPKHGKISMTQQEAAEYRRLLADPRTTADALRSWAERQGRSLSNADTILGFVRQHPNAIPTTFWDQADALDIPVESNVTPVGTITAPGFLDRAGALFGRGFSGLESGLYSIGSSLRDWSANTPLPWLSDEANARNRASDLEIAQGLRTQADVARATARAPIEGETTWQDVKADPWRAPGFILDSAVGSAPSVAGALVAPVVYGAARTGEIADERAHNNAHMTISDIVAGRPPDVRPSLGDYAAAAPFAAADVALGRFGMGGTLSAGQPLVRGTLTAGAKGSAMMAGQSVADYAGETLGTRRGFDPAEAADRALAGVVAGFPALAGGHLAGRGVRSVVPERVASGRARPDAHEQRSASEGPGFEVTRSPDLVSTPPPPDGFVLDHAAMAMANESPDPVLHGPAVLSREPDRIDVRASHPAPIDQGMSHAQLRASSERLEPQDVMPLSRTGDRAAVADADGERTFAGNIRLEGLDTPQDINRALIQTAQRVGMEGGTRGKISQAETQALANEMGMTAEQLMARRKGEAFNAEQALAARQILAKSGNELVNLARRVQRMDDPGEEALAAFRHAWVRHVAIQEQVAGMTAEAGRTLSQFRMVADGRNVRGNVLNALSESGGGKDRLKDAADLILEHADNPGDMNRVAAKALQPKFLDKINELWINSLLSGPQTHVVNAVSNTMTSLAQIPEHAVAAGVGGIRSLAWRNNTSDRVLFSELGARSVGLMQGVKEGLRQAVRTARTGEGSDFANKVEAQTPDAISGVKGKIIRTPTRMLSASDELYKAMARRMELAGLAVRQASAEGLKGEAGRQRVADLIAHPTDEMLDKAFDYGRYVTFQRPLSGAMQGLSRFTQQMPGMKFILPFVRTPTNLLKFSLERSPAAPLIDTWRKDFKAGGARRDLAVARAMVGTGVGALVMELAAKGDITGNGPADDKARQILQADGWQPYSVRVGDKYYSYSRLDPFATTLGVAAGMVEMQEHMTDRQKDKVAMLLTASIMQNLSSKTWLSGIGDMVQAVDDPARYADSWWKRFAGSAAVPAGVAQVARTLDPALHEAETTLDAIRARVPGLSKSLPPRRDVWGQPIVGEGGAGPDIVSPAYLSTRKNDPVNKALLDANVHVGKPQRTWAGRDLSANDYGAYHELSGALGKASVMEIVSSPDWKTMNQDERQEAVDKAMRGGRKEAREQMPEVFGR